jgi:hypothetical protein
VKNGDDCGTISPKCSSCNFCTSWAFIDECDKCQSYLCNICKKNRICTFCK